MRCPSCRQITPDDAAFCGNCGAPLTVGSAEQAGLNGVTELAVPAENVAATTRDHSWQAVLALVIGLLGLAGWLVPYAGMLAGLVALVLGTIAFHSRRRVFARSGILLSVLVLSASLFMWVHSAQRLDGTASAQETDTSSLQAVTTDCFSTRVPASMRLSVRPASCSFQATNPQNGEQYVVKTLDVPGLSANNLASAAAPDAANVAKTVPGGRVQDERSVLFAGNVAYRSVIIAQDGSGGSVEYVYTPTKAGNLLVLSHSIVHLSADNSDASLLENNWSWQ